MLGLGVQLGLRASFALRLLAPSARSFAMKRKTSPNNDKSPAKRKRADVPEYHLTPTLKNDRGEDVWPAPRDQIERAQQIIKGCAQAGKRTIICPDKDADGLTSGVILYRTLQLLGLSSDLIVPHLLEKGTSVHSEVERERMSSHEPAYVFILDHGSRSCPPLVPNEHTCLVIDHHHATPADFPQGSAFITACNSPPVATTSLLTYLLCRDLHPLVEEQCDWLAIIGTHGDLGTTLKWAHPFPDMAAPLKRYTKKAINDAVSAVNAPRRTATFDVSVAWNALLTASGPKDVLKHGRLADARREVAEEVERCTHTAPRFSPDGRIAVFRITSAAQVHPVIATRWANHLSSSKLEIVMVANDGYLPGKVNFSCRVARVAKARTGDDGVDIIRALKDYASPDGGGDGGEERPLLERLGDDFARGHVQASGGIVSSGHFDELLSLMRIGEKSDAQKAKEEQRAAGGGNHASPKKGGKKVIDSGQTNTLAGYFGKKKEAPTSS